MSLPDLKINTDNRGYVKYPRNWKDFHVMDRADFVKDWITELEKQYASILASDEWCQTNLIDREK